MANTKKIKAQIKSVSNINQITKALEIVATVKLQKVKQQTEQYREFMIDFLKIVQVLNTKTNIFEENTNTKNKKDLIIVIGTDKGLCGSLNNKLFKNIFIEYEDKKNNTDIFCIGKKSLEFFGRSNFNIAGNINLNDNFTENDLSGIYTFIKDAINKNKYKSISIHFNYFKNAITQIPLNFQLFPLDKTDLKNFSQKIDIDLDNLISPIIEKKELLLEPNPSELAEEIKKQLLQHMIYGSLLQNKTGEFAARMVAMKNAKDNSTTLIKDLQLSFNKARQGVITQEISEIVGAKMAIETK